MNDRLLNSLRVFQLERNTNFPIRCVASKNLMVNPCISLDCKHIQRIQLKYFLEYCYKVKDWQCPVCLQKTQLKNIQVDSLLKQSLEFITDHSLSIKIKTNLQYKILEIDIVDSLFQKVRKRVLRGYDSGSQLDKTVGFWPTYLNTDRQKNEQFLISSRTYQSIDIESNILNDFKSNLCLKSVFWFPQGQPWMYCFDWKANTWINKPHIPNLIPTIRDFQIIYIQNNAYIIGGVNKHLQTVSSTYYIDKSTGLWRLKDMHIPRHQFAYTNLDNYYIYVIGGITTNSFTSAVQVFNLTFEEWELRSSINIERAGATACCLNNRSILLFGGTNQKKSFVLDIEEYRVDQDQWFILDVLMEWGLIGGKAFAVPNTKAVLILGGYTDRGESNKVGMFYRPQQRWMVLTDLGKRVIDHTKFPVVYDELTHFVHFFNGIQEPIYHIFYSIRYLIENLVDQQENEQYFQDCQYEKPEVGKRRLKRSRLHSSKLSKLLI